MKLENLEIKIFEADLLDLKSNISFIEKFENNILGLIWVSGFTGNPDVEYLAAMIADIERAQRKCSTL